jgi:hypothetical protein
VARSDKEAARIPAVTAVGQLLDAMDIKIMEIPATLAQPGEGLKLEKMPATGCWPGSESAFFVPVDGINASHARTTCH